MSATSVRELCRQWVGRLGHYRRHQNDEHLESLIAEALRYTGLHLENELSASPYWSKAPLSRRVATLLLLVDRAVVSRVIRDGRITFEAREDITRWVTTHLSTASLLVPTLEFVASIQTEQGRRAGLADL